MDMCLSLSVCLRASLCLLFVGQYGCISESVCEYDCTYIYMRGYLYGIIWIYYYKDMRIYLIISLFIYLYGSHYIYLYLIISIYICGFMYVCAYLYIFLNIKKSFFLSFFLSFYIYGSIMLLIYSLEAVDRIDGFPELRRRNSIYFSI